MVVEYIMDSENDASKARHRYIARPVKKSKRQQAKEKSESIKAEAMNYVYTIFTHNVHVANATL